MEHDDQDDFVPSGSIGVGDLLADSARIIGANLGTFLVATTLVMSPAIAANVIFSEWVQRKARILLMSAADPVESYESIAAIAATMMLGVLVTLVIQTLTWFLAQAPVVYVTVEHMAGERASLGEALGRGLSGAVTLSIIAITVTVFAGLGTILCLIPGLIVLTVFFAAVPAAVAERLGPIEALQRSADLTLGHRVTVFAVLAVILLSYFAVSWMSGQIIGLGGAAGADPGDPTSLLLPLPFRIVSYVVSWALMVAVSIPLATVSAVFYARVRGIRDGVDAEEIASVFA